MNAIVTVQQDSPSPPPGAEPVPTSAEGAGPHTILTPRAEGPTPRPTTSFDNARFIRPC